MVSRPTGFLGRVWWVEFKGSYMVPEYGPLPSLKVRLQKVSQGI